MANIEIYQKATQEKIAEITLSEIDLTLPSIVKVELHREDIKEFLQEGDDLVLILNSGEKIVIHEFFETFDTDYHSDLVLLDDECGFLWFDFSNGVASFQPISGLEVLIPSTSTLSPILPWIVGGVVGGAIIAGSDGGGSSNPPANKPPVASADPIVTNEDVPFSGKVTAQDSNQDPLTYSVTTAPEHGLVSIDPKTGEYTYTPNPNANGTDSFVVTVSDGKGGSTTVTIPVTIMPVNDVPTATADPITTPEGEAVSGKITANDVDGDPLTFEVTEQPSKGTVTINPNTGEYTYSPNPLVYGEDKFTVEVDDGHGGKVSVNVVVNIVDVNHNPEAQTSALNTPEDTPVAGKVTATDVDGDKLSYIVSTTPNSGVVTIDDSTGQYTYTPNANYHGSDSFTVTVNDGKGGTTTVTVPVTVVPVNDAPTATANPITTTEDTPVTGKVTGTDVDGDALTYTEQTPPNKGTVTLNPNTGEYIYTPNPDTTGEDKFTVEVSDGKGGTTTVEVTVNITPENDVPVAGNSTVTGDEDTPITGKITATDKDGDPLTYTEQTPPSKGTVTIDPNTGDYTYTPNPNATGEDTFTVEVNDGNGGTTTVEVTVNITPVNDAPTASSPAITTKEDTPVTGQVTGQDVDGDSLTYTVTTPSSKGDIVLNPATGLYTYTPYPDATGLDSFVVTVSDGKGGTTTVTIPVTISPVNDAPIATPTSSTTNEDQPVKGQIVARDPDQDLLTYSVTTTPEHGTVSLDPTTGAYTYTPNANYNGSDSFTVLVDDGKGGTTSITVPVTINAVNDAPTATAPDVTTRQEIPVTGQVKGNDTEDGSQVSYSVATGPTANGGTVSIDPVSGQYTYTAGSTYSPQDSFTVTVTDSAGATTTVDITVTILKNNDPTAEDQLRNIDEDTVLSSKIDALDIDGDSLNYQLDEQPLKGNVIINALTGEYSYTPHPNTTGEDVFFVTVMDEFGGTARAEVIITVNPVNDAPTASTTPVSTAEDTAVIGQIVGTDVDKDPLTYEVTQPPAHGQVSIDPNTGAYTYTPNANYNGTDSFVVTVSDGKGGTSTVTVPVTVTPVNNAPQGTTDPVTVNEDTPVTGKVTGTDVDGDPLTYTEQTPPSKGTVMIDPNTGDYTYTPNPNSNGEDTFTVTITDGNGGSTTVEVVVNITPVNDAPTGQATTVTTPEDTAVTGKVVGNDIDGDALTYTEQTPPSKGTVSLDPNTGNYIYTPNANTTGEDTFTVTITDGKGGSTTVEVTVNITPVNDAPTASTDPITTLEDTPVTGKVTGTDVDGDQLTYTEQTPPNKGTVTIDPNTGEYSYTPNPNANGTDSFTVEVSDGNGGSTTVEITVNITPVNDAPTATTDPITTTEDTPVTGKVTGTDVDGDTLTYTEQTPPSKGTVIIDPNTGEYSYTPNANSNGQDSFTVEVSDGKGGTTTVEVTVNVIPVNDAPTATVDPVTTAEDTPVTGKVTGTDVDGDTLTYTEQTPPSKGTVSIDPNTGEYTYTPNPNVTGEDKFTVEVSDGNGGSTTVEITVNITPVNDAPTATANPITTIEDTPVTGKVTGTDVDGDALTYTEQTPPNKGTVTINPNTGEYIYTPNPDITGEDKFTVEVSDGKGGTTTVEVTVNITPENDAPNVPNYNFTIDEDQSLTGTVVGSDADNDVLSYRLSSNTVDAPSKGMVVVYPDGSYVYTANPNANGVDQFKIVVDDGHGGTVVSTIVVNITPVNDAPSVSRTPETLITPEDKSVSGQINAQDVDGDVLTYGIDAAPSHGTVTINSSGQYVYTPNANYFGSDNFTVVVSDGKGGNVSLVVPVEVTPVNDLPTTSNQSLNTTEDVAINGTVIAADIDNDTLSYSVSTQPSKGTVSIDPATGQFVYTPAMDANGTDSFKVTIDDGQGGQTVSTISVNISAVNDAPVAHTSPEALTTPEEQKVFGQVNATDVDGDQLTYVVSENPAHGTVELQPDGSYAYTPELNFNGSDSFKITVSDGNGGTVTVTVPVTVTPVNDAPITSNQTLTTAEDTAITDKVVATDVDGDSLSYTLVGQPSKGSVILQSDGSYSYTPHQDENGTDTFRVEVSDGKGGVAISVITVNISPVNDLPTGYAPAITTPEDQQIDGQIIANDRDGDTVIYNLVTGAAHGTVTLRPDGSYTYTPTADYNGSDSFVVGITDQSGTVTPITVNVVVTPENDNPLGYAEPIITSEDMPKQGQINGSDVDGDSLTYTMIENGKPSKGTVTLDENSGTYTYTPLNNQTGSDSFDVIVSDGQGGQTTVTVQVEITPVNDAPTVPDYSLTTSEDMLVSGVVTGSDVDGDSLTYRLSNSDKPANGSVVVNSDGTFSYTPKANFFGQDSFKVIVDDGHGGTTLSTVNIVVTEVNDVPVVTITPDTLTTPEDTSVSGRVTGSDVDGDTLTYSIGSTVTHGTVTIDANTGVYQYQPNDNYFGPDSFTVVVTDGRGGSTTVTVPVVVTPVNDLPTATADPIVTLEDTPQSGKVVANDIDGDSLSYSVSTGATKGSVSIDAATGSYIYTPDANANGADEFIVTINDGHGGTTQVKVPVTITPVNDAPTIQSIPQSLTTPEDQAISGKVVANDVDGDTLTYSVTSNALHGVVTISADGSYIYTPANNYYGNDQFTVTVNDGSTTTSIVIPIIVTPVNDVPTTQDYSFDIDENAVISGNVAASDVDTTDVLSYSIVKQPTLGKVTLDPATGNYTYTPNANISGTDTFEVEVNDGNGGHVISTVTVNINPVDDLFVDGDENPTTLEDTVLTGNVIDSGLTSGDGPIFVQSYQVAGTTYTAGQTAIISDVGSIIIDANGVYTFTPAANYHGTVPSISYTLSDGYGAVETSNLNITVTPVDDLFNDGNETITLNEDVIATGNVIDSGLTSGDGPITLQSFQVSGSTQVYSAGSIATINNVGTITISASGAYIFTPVPNYSGTVPVITYTLTDGFGALENSNLSFTYNAVNDGATTIVSGNSGASNEDTVISNTLVIADPDGITNAKFAVQTNASNGTASIDATGKWSYTPKADWNGTDSFTVLITDDQGFTTVQTINVTVNAVADATADTATVNEDSSIPIDVLSNDSYEGEGKIVTHINGTAIAVGGTVAVTNGTVTLTTDGKLNFTPVPNYFGTVNFNYTSKSPTGVAETTTVTVNVVAQNDSFTDVSETVSINEDTPINGNVLEGTSSVDGPVSVVSFMVGGTTYTAGQSATITGVGTLLINASGSYSFTPVANWSGSVPTVSYNVSDTLGPQVTSTLNISVVPVADAPTISFATQSSSMTNMGLTVTTWTNVNLGNSNGFGVAGDILESAIEGLVNAGTVPSSTIASTTNLASTSVAAGNAIDATGYVYLEKGKTYTISMNGDDTVRLVFANPADGGTVIDTRWGTEAGKTKTVQFSPTESGLFSLELYMHNQAGPGSYSVSVVESGTSTTAKMFPTLTAASTELAKENLHLGSLVGTSNTRGYYKVYGVNQGEQNTEIQLSDVTVGLVDKDGSETISNISIKQIPVGATLSDGVNTFTATAGNTTANISNWNLKELTIKSPTVSTINMTIEATSKEAANGTTATTILPLTINVYAASSVLTGPEMLPQNHNQNNVLDGGAGNDILLGDTGGTETVIEPGHNYNVAFLVDTSGSMAYGLDGSPAPAAGQSRMDLLKEGLKYFATVLAEHDSTINVTLIGFSADSLTTNKISIKDFDPTDLTAFNAAVDALVANGGTNYEAGFEETTNWFNTSADVVGSYENVTYFLTDGNPTYYMNGTTEAGDGATTTATNLQESIKGFVALAAKSEVHAIGLGNGVTKDYLNFFDNTSQLSTTGSVQFPLTYTKTIIADFPTTFGGAPNGTADNNKPTDWSSNGNGTVSFVYNDYLSNSGYINLNDSTNAPNSSSLVVTSKEFNVSRANSYITLDLLLNNAYTGDVTTVELEQKVNGLWISTNYKDGYSATSAISGTYAASLQNIAAGTYRLKVTAADNSSYTTSFNNYDFTVGIDNIVLNTPATYTNVTGATGEPVVVSTKTEFYTALFGGKSAFVLMGVGNDTIDGLQGNDVLFGDVINTDNLNWASLGKTKPLHLPNGSGLLALEEYLTISLGHKPTESDLYTFIQNNHASLNVAGDTRGGNDTIRGGEGNDIIYGQGGNDTIYGGQGNDIINGGTGIDTVVYNVLLNSDSGAGHDIDRWTDFNRAEDVLKFDAGFFLSTVTASNASNFIKLNYDAAAKTVTVSVDRDGTSGAFGDKQLVVLENQSSALTIADLLNGNHIVF